MYDIRDHLSFGETLLSAKMIKDDVNDFDVITVRKPDLPDNSCVLLDVRGATEPNVLTGGNPLDIEVLEGFGMLWAMELDTGTQEIRFLEPGVKVEIPSDNIVYYYKNLGEYSLLLKDTCPEFDIANEPKLRDVATTLISLF